MAVTEAQGAIGVLPITLGGKVMEVPVLPMREAREWKQHVWEALADVKGVAADNAEDVADLDSVEAARVIEERIRTLDEMTVDRAIDLIVEYDRRGALGGRDGIEAIASPRQIRRALEAMREESFPFGEEMTWTQMLQVVAARSARLSSTNGHSPSGISPQDHLKPRSPSGSTGSSGKRVRRA